MIEKFIPKKVKSKVLYVRLDDALKEKVKKEYKKLKITTSAEFVRFVIDFYFKNKDKIND